VRCAPPATLHTDTLPARRLQLPQLLLSLDLPPLGEPGAPETSAAMLGLERGLLDALRAHVAAQGGASIA
jgi:hypothetical protein